MSRINNELNKFFGKIESQTSLETKQEYGEKISKEIEDALVGKDGKTSVNINGREFELIKGYEIKKIAEKQIQETEELLNSPIGHYLKQKTKILLKAAMNTTNREIQKLGDEYNDYHNMDRADFLTKTNSTSILEETIEHLSNTDRNKELASKLVSIATKRLKELKSEQK